MKRTLRRVTLAMAALALAGAATIAWVKLAPRPTPPGQPPLATLEKKSFGELREAFNASADRTRVVALLSPT